MNFTYCNTLPEEVVLCSLPSWRRHAQYEQQGIPTRKRFVLSSSEIVDTRLNNWPTRSNLFDRATFVAGEEASLPLENTADDIYSFLSSGRRLKSNGA